MTNLQTLIMTRVRDTMIRRADSATPADHYCGQYPVFCSAFIVGHSNESSQSANGLESSECVLTL